MYEGIDGYSSNNVQQYQCSVCGKWHFNEMLEETEEGEKVCYHCLVPR